jgi:hypothetical protein
MVRLRLVALLCAGVCTPALHPWPAHAGPGRGGAAGHAHFGPSLHGAADIRTAKRSSFCSAPACARYPAIPMGPPFSNDCAAGKSAHSPTHVPGAARAEFSARPTRVWHRLDQAYSRMAGEWERFYAPTVLDCAVWGPAHASANPIARSPIAAAVPAFVCSAPSSSSFRRLPGNLERFTLLARRLFGPPRLHVLSVCL